MTRSWKDVKADKARHDVEAGRDVAQAREDARTRTQAFILGFRLARLREQRGLSQSQVAARMGISQPRVSQLERGEVDQLVVETLHRYVAALGGHLRVVADFDDHDVTVSTNEVDRSDDRSTATA
ncbi:XRE family transcriptional regulator [Actinosynnema sp. NPDC050801]|uniref:XRE family transcriptional regulator n=1 Tax=unclassified Actinosynnema TaxID=2637065 RepID=UPI0033D01C7B